MRLTSRSKASGCICIGQLAIDSNGNTVEFYFCKDRDLAAAKRFLRKALARHGRPEGLAYTRLLS